MCPEEGGAAGLDELRSWWEVPAIAHFCSLFRTAFRLPDFEIEVVGCVKMKLNVSFPATSCQKLIEVDDEHKLRMFCEKPMATEVAADALGEEWKGYVVRIIGRNEKVFP